MIEGETRTRIIEHATALKGRRHQSRGRSPHGMDCIGLVLLVSGLVGSPHDRIDYRPQTAVDGELREALLGAGFTRVDVEDARPGDLVTFRWWRKGDRVERHPGILTETGFIHTNEATGCVVEVSYHQRWQRLTVGAYQFPHAGEDR